MVEPKAATGYRVTGSAAGRVVIELSVKRRAFRIAVDGPSLVVTIGSRVAGPGRWDAKTANIALHRSVYAAIVNANRTNPISVAEVTRRVRDALLDLGATTRPRSPRRSDLVRLRTQE